MPKIKAFASGVEEATATKHLAPASESDDEMTDDAPKRRRPSVRGPAAAPSRLFTARGRARTARLANRADADADQRRVDRWIVERPPGRAPAIAASERLAALKERLAARQGPAGK